MTAVVSKYYKGISAERRKKEFFKAVGFESRQVKISRKRGKKAMPIRKQSTAKQAIKKPAESSLKNSRILFLDIAFE